MIVCDTGRGDRNYYVGKYQWRCTLCIKPCEDEGMFMNITNENDNDDNNNNDNNIFTGNDKGYVL